MHMIGRLRRETHRRDTRWKSGVAVASASFALAGALAFTINPSAAAGAGYPKSFGNEADQGTYQGFAPATLSDLSPQCPQAIAATPGSEPSNKFLNTALNDADSKKPGGVVHYSYIDNPTFASTNYTIQDCVVVYPESTFSDGDFDENTGVITGSVSKSDLNKGVQIDGAAFSGVLDSTGATYFNWTAPTDLVGGQWVCNFARDISTGHGGGGNRKTLPSCYQVPKTPVDEPTVVAGACGEKDTISLPSTEGVSWFLDDTQTSLADGDELEPGAHTVIAQQEGQDDQNFPITASTVEDPATCNPTVTPNVPTHPTSACGVSDTYVIPVDDFFDFVLVTGSGQGETTAPIADGSHNLASGVVVHIRAVKHDNVSDTTTGDTDWTFTGRAITACQQTGGNPTPDPIPTTTTTTTEAPTTTTTEAPTTTTTTTELVLPFTPEPEVITTTTMAPAPELAFTGSNSGYLAMMGLVLVGFGGLLFAGTSRKRRTTS